jgi:hypothetical protein
MIPKRSCGEILSPVETKLMVLRVRGCSPGSGKCSSRSGRRQVRRQWGGKGGKNRFILELLGNI